MEKETVSQLQEAQRLSRINLRRHMPRHIVTKLTEIKDKEKIVLKIQQIIYKKTPIKFSANCLTETLKVRREWYNIFKMMKGKNLQPRVPRKVLIQI